MDLKGLKVYFIGKEKLKTGYAKEEECNFYSIKLKKDKEKKINHHILLIDVSYSMRDEIEKLKEKLKLTLEGLKRGKNNYVSIIIYAGHLQSKRIVEGVYCDKKSYEMGEVFRKLEAEIYTRNGTVLSEPLEKSIEIVEGLANICNRHNIILFTDGCLVSEKWSIKEEKDKVFNLLEKLKEKEVSFNPIGFGKYYDRNLLVELMEKSGGGEFSHIEEIKDYNKKVLKVTENIAEEKSVNLKIENKKYFILNTDKIYEESNINIKVKENEILICTFDEELKIDNKIYINRSVEKRKEKIIEEFLYRLSLYHLLNEDIQSAEISIGETGDIEGYKLLQNCFSFLEVGNAINKIKELIRHKEKRFKKGKVEIKTDTIEENMCILELLEEIINDKESKLLWDYSYDYKRIGKLTKRKEDRYTFMKPIVGFGEVSDITIGSRKLNVGLTVRVKGEVIDTETMLKLDAHTIRQYNLILNGNINTDRIACILSKELLKKFRKEKIIKEKNKFGKEEIYILNLKKLKTTNKRIMRTLTLEEIGEGLYEVENLKCKIWAIKKRLEEVAKKRARKRFSLKEKIRLNYRVNENGLYKPLAEGKEEKFKEVYKAKILEWKIEGFKKKKATEDALAFYRSEKNEKKLRDELNVLKKRKNEILYKINLVRIGYGLANTPSFLWEEEKEKIKIEMDKGLGLNTIVDEKIIISTRKVNNIRLRQDKYEILTKCD